MSISDNSRNAATDILRKSNIDVNKEHATVFRPTAMITTNLTYMLDVILRSSTEKLQVLLRKRSG